ncbi:hypothetical protein SARC_16560 [Sphaeroforma arctica JP610]|uniref:Uncharacterized protein n=1 Tax=Sphaeroforma arctica JP610 TaxID=667725 RepID=A0A0L0F405_9EUKA|nr:hypothetical protein SARC_16560 [Sphaeroforma arctica JP610]KNC70908.1 hypothetical protein SARC_16560 [Sphaeroforma arctica JP610]|eukprot:XP_014144810.1 hypothetical protein SARC_16560 [Sphaeroforma arctica JP610]
MCNESLRLVCHYAQDSEVKAGALSAIMNNTEKFLREQTIAKAVLQVFRAKIRARREQEEHYDSYETLSMANVNEYNSVNGVNNNAHLVSGTVSSIYSHSKSISRFNVFSIYRSMNVPCRHLSGGASKK